jgi:glycosyltransferase involved in cell wall biosynthesis
MRFIYLTAKGYPASTADHIYILELAKGFNAILKDNFLFVVANAFGNDLQGLPVLNLHLSLQKFRTAFYFFWLPYFILRDKHTKSDSIFFSNDPNILTLLIFWKRLLRLHYRICSDWHMLFGDWRDRFIARGSDFIVTTSAKLRRAIAADAGVSEEKILVAYGGIDVEKRESLNISEARNQLHLPFDKKIVSYIGFFKTMGMEKGIRTMIESLSTLPSGVIMLFVGGKDDEIAEYIAYAETLGVAKRCVFIARKLQSELATYEAASDILAIPYPDKPHFREFGFPMKVYEYMAADRPILYSKLDLVEEVIGDCAYSFIPDDAVSFAKTVEEILGDVGRASNNAAKAYEKVKKYTWVSKADTIIQNVTSQTTR